VESDHLSLSCLNSITNYINIPGQKLGVPPFNLIKKFLATFGKKVEILDLIERLITEELAILFLALNFLWLYSTAYSMNTLGGFFGAFRFIKIKQKFFS